MSKQIEVPYIFGAEIIIEKIHIEDIILPYEKEDAGVSITVKQDLRGNEARKIHSILSYEEFDKMYKNADIVS